MGVPLSMQTSMSVRMVMTTVMRMQTALTQREISPAPITLATLEMETSAQVSYHQLFWYLLPHVSVYHRFEQILMSATGCEHNCTDTIGSFNCSCDVGYLLDGNGFN